MTGAVIFMTGMFSVTRGTTHVRGREGHDRNYDCHVRDCKHHGRGSSYIRDHVCHDRNHDCHGRDCICHEKDCSYVRDCGRCDRNCN